MGRPTFARGSGRMCTGRHDATLQGRIIGGRGGRARRARVRRRAGATAGARREGTTGCGSGGARDARALRDAAAGAGPRREGTTGCGGGGGRATRGHFGMRGRWGARGAGALRGAAVGSRAGDGGTSAGSPSASPLRALGQEVRELQALRRAGAGRRRRLARSHLRALLARAAVAHVASVLRGRGGGTATRCAIARGVTTRAEDAGRHVVVELEAGGVRLRQALGTRRVRGLAQARIGATRR
jgi:hypothetical protein